jgi:hypothetical protein
MALLSYLTRLRNASGVDFRAEDFGPDFSSFGSGNSSDFGKGISLFGRHVGDETCKLVCMNLPSSPIMDRDFDQNPDIQDE